MSDLKMPDRAPTDGAVNITDLDERIAISVVTDGRTDEITCSPYNAWRVFGLLALMLGIPLPTKVGKAIKL